MEHAVHLGTGHFIKAVSPTSARTLVKKIRKAFHNAQLDDDNMLWKLILEVMTTMSKMRMAPIMLMMKLMMKQWQILLLVTLLVNPSHLSNRSVHPNICKQVWADTGLQICSSPQATAFFNQCCR
jgi:hypothetical protein